MAVPVTVAVPVALPVAVAVAVAVALAVAGVLLLTVCMTLPRCQRTNLRTRHLTCPPTLVSNTPPLHQTTPPPPFTIGHPTSVSKPRPSVSLYQISEEWQEPSGLFRGRDRAAGVEDRERRKPGDTAGGHA